jgi:SIT4-associating protein SAP185/190
MEFLLTPFWEVVLPPLRPSSPTSNESASQMRREQTEKERARDEFWSDEDEERHRKQEAIRGMWTRINGTLLTKRPSEVGWAELQHLFAHAVTD